MSNDMRPESMIRELISPRCSREQRINESHNTITHSIIKQRYIRPNKQYSVSPWAGEREV
jgi:hypothetical protein